MSHHEHHDPLGRALGWFSVGLGAAQLAMPDAVNRMVGVRATPTARRVMRAMGAREVAAGVAILATHRTVFFWGRVAGDVLDLALLTLGRSPGAGARTAGAAAAVVGATVADVMRSVSGDPAPSHTRAVATVNRAPDEVRRAWDDLHAGVGTPGSVTFTEAPAGQGTEVVLETSDGHARDELRRFKQLVETGHVVRSDATPDAGGTLQQLPYRAAQPAEVSS
ncbi:MAG TPA: hypothetical protein VM840_09970 [Actinomycetota bacterium]|nr:hypothetical protein [Actinomycetota bacterium]